MYLPTPSMSSFSVVELCCNRWEVETCSVVDSERSHTEIDRSSYICASSNIATNGLQSRIHLHKQEPHEPILSPLLSPDAFDFTMCNPPFYSSREEIEKSTTEKEFSPSAVCTGADTEMITPGGESAFVQQMVTESLVYRTKCRSLLVTNCYMCGY
jgi:23S rRNA A1618 N6-methylase RlmF